MTKATEIAQDWVNFFTRNKTHLMGLALIFVGAYRIATGELSLHALSGEMWQLLLGGGLMTLKQDTRDGTKETVKAVQEAKSEVQTEVAVVAATVQHVQEKT